MMKALSEHPIFLGLRDYEWDAVSSIATGAAAVIAILVPTTLRWLDRRAEQRREQARAADEQKKRVEHVLMIAHAYRRTGELLRETRTRLNRQAIERSFGTARAIAELKHPARIAAQRAVVMRTLAKQTGMDERSIACLLSAAAALDAIAALPGMPPEEVNTFFGDAGHEFWLGIETLDELAANVGTSSVSVDIPVFNTTFDTDGPDWR